MWLKAAAILNCAAFATRIWLARRIIEGPARAATDRR